jgi:hypothetical protein
LTVTEHHETLALASTLISAGCLRASSSASPNPISLAAAQLPIAQVIEGLGDDGLVEWVCCGHAGLPRFMFQGPQRRLQVEQAAGQSQQAEQLDQRGVAQSSGRVALAVQQRRQVDDELPVVQTDIGGLLTGQASQQRQDGTAQRRWVCACGTAGEADAVWAVIDALAQVCLDRDLAGKLRDVDAQALGRVQAASMYQTSEIG